MKSTQHRVFGSCNGPWRHYGNGGLTLRTIVLMLCVYCIPACSTSEWVEVKCADAQYATRLPRDPASSYRHYGSMYESGYDASEVALDRLIPRLSQSDTLRIIASDFKRYLVTERAAVQSQLEKAVVALQDNPCDKDARKNFQFLIEYINFNGRYLHRIPKACKDTSLDLGSMLMEYRRERD